MSENSAIEWTHHTFNPWWGCTKVSPGCSACYAEAFDKRVGGAHWGPGVERRTFGEKHWNEPKKWDAKAAKLGERHRVFCSSMADVFDAEAPAGQIERLWPLIRETPHLDWLLLTKRPERIGASLPADWGDGYPNVWLGTSVEDQTRAAERIHRLTFIPAVVRFLSCEPLLGPIDFERAEVQASDAIDPEWRDGRRGTPIVPSALGDEDRSARIHWVIVGGESGPKARPMHPDWVRGIRDQCVAAGVAFLFKQWGEHITFYARDDDPDAAALPKCTARERWLNITGGHGFHGERVVAVRNVGKKAAGRTLDGKIWDEYPTPRRG